MTRSHRAIWHGLLFGCVLLFFGFAAAGMGHGTYLPLTVYGAPLSAVPFLDTLAAPTWWVIVGWTISSHRPKATGTMLAVHVLSVGLFLWLGTPMEHGEEWTYLNRAQEHLWIWIWGGFVIYAVGLAIASNTAITKLARVQRY